MVNTITCIRHDGSHPKACRKQLSHAFHSSLAESSSKWASKFLLRRNKLSPQPFWLNQSVNNRNEHRQVGRSKILDLKFVGLVTMRQISGCDSCE